MDAEDEVRQRILKPVVMNVIIVGEFTGEIREAFVRHGHNAWSCDLIPSERGGQHFQCDCRLLDYSMFDLAIIHPTCTRLSLSGVRWLYTQDGRWEQMVEDAMFFRWAVDLRVAKKCIENPVQHNHARAIIQCEYDQIIQPWQFGHGETKATCLWLFGLPNLIPTNIVSGREPVVHHMAPSPTRGRDRSRTYPGIAEAMAAQWGSLV